MYKLACMLIVNISLLLLLGLLLCNYCNKRKSARTQKENANAKITSKNSKQMEERRKDAETKPDIFYGNKNIFFVWVGKYPDPQHLKQIKLAVKTAQDYNPYHDVYLFTNLLTEKEVNCKIVPIHYKNFYADSPLGIIKMGPEGECPPDWKCTHPALWSDIFRCLILWRYGGTYIDVDDNSVRSLPTTLNVFPAAAIEDEREMIQYSNGISGEYMTPAANYNFRFGIDPLINIERGNPFFAELLRRASSNSPKDWGQVLPTKIFASDPARWSKYVTPTPWHDLLYHPKHDGHTNFDQRYIGLKIKYSDYPTEENMKTIIDNYDFCIVKNHHFSSTSQKTVLGELLKV